MFRIEESNTIFSCHNIRGSGILILYQNSLQVKNIARNSFDSAENITNSITINTYIAIDYLNPRKAPGVEIK